MEFEIYAQQNGETVRIDSISADDVTDALDKAREKYPEKSQLSATR